MWHRRKSPRFAPARSQAPPSLRAQGDPHRARLRTVLATIALMLAFAAVGGQLARLAARGDAGLTLAVSEPVAGTFARPDIVDRNGRLLATDIETQSLFADPALVLDRNEVSEKVSAILPDLDQQQLLASLSDRSRRFVWIRRGLSARTAQRIHDLGLPGLSFRPELRRVYPGGALAGHIIGTVDIDNRGVLGLERHIDERVGIEAVHGATRSDRAPVRLSLDLGVQHAVEDELARAIRRYGADSAAAVVLDVTTGEVLGSASLPGVDPSRPAETQEPARLDRVAGGRFELGSIFKIMTLAMALDGGKASLASIVDVTQPIVEGATTIRDPHPAGRPLTLAEVFTQSSNVGAAQLALEAGPDRHREFLGRLGLLSPLATEAGPVAPPQTPARWERIEQATVSYGHGIAVAPLQFAAAAAALVNGGDYIAPGFTRRMGEEPARVRVVSEETSRRVNELLRLNVTEGTGKRAEVQGYKVGGKTGTAEIAIDGKYRKDKVISSFLAAFPMDRPKYVVLVSLFEPKPSDETKGEIAAAVNAAPSAGRLIRRIAPLLGVLPEGTLAEAE